MLDLVAISDKLCVLLSLLTMNAELREYRKLFQQMIQENDSGIIDNSSRAHAKVILQELVRSAKHEILIQCSRLAKDIYGDLETQRLLMNALQNGIRVSIAIRDSIPETECFCTDLDTRFPGTVHRHTSVLPLDFCVVDGKRFRLEKDKTLGTAFVCANNVNISSKLQAIYNSEIAAA